MHSNLAIFGGILLIGLRRILAQIPANDKCSGATTISSVPFNLNSIDTSLATSDVNTTICNVNAADVGVWYSFLGNDKIVKIELLNPTFNAKIAVFSGTCSVLKCVQDSGSGDVVNWPATSNVPYLILISGVSQSKGTFNIVITDVTRHPNDNCENAIEITSNAQAKGYNTFGAFPDFTEPSTCTVDNDVRGIWFKFTPSSDRIFTVKTSAVTFNHRIAIFTGTACGNLACFDARATGNPGLSYTWAGKAGQQYNILVTGFSVFGEVGTFTIEITDIVRPPNDNCENAIEITSNAQAKGYNTFGAFPDFTEPSTCTVDNDVRGIWFKFTPSSDRIFTVKTSAVTFNHRIAIFTGTACGNLACFDARATGNPGLPYTWAGKAGQQYNILVTGFSVFEEVGTFTIELSDKPRPKNDDCVSAIEIMSSNTTRNGDTSGSFADVIIGPQCTVTATGRGSWYFFVGGGGTVRAEIQDAVFNAKLIVFSGPCNNVGCVTNNDGSGFAALVTFPTVIGVKYFLLVTGSDFSDSGTFVLKVTGDVQGPTISPTIKPVTLPPNNIPVPIVPVPGTPVVTPMGTQVVTPMGTPSAPIPSAPTPTASPTGFFRELFRRLFGWIFN